MVRCATSGKEGDFLVARNDRQIAPQRLRIADKIGALFGAEDAMHQNGSMGVGHYPNLNPGGTTFGDAAHTSVCGPYRGSGMSVALPSVSRWAILSRAYGARAFAVDRPTRTGVLGRVDRSLCRPRKGFIERR